jgi:energy-coupling factor transporter ATP-binding protein EcfA2
MSTMPTSFPGSRWWRFDFHSHTPASSDYGEGPDKDKLKQRTPREWLSDYIAAGIECVAITDHNSGDWIDPLKAELAKMRSEGVPGSDKLHLFPGVELTITGAHYLAIFDTTATSRNIQDLLAVARCDTTVPNASAFCIESVTTVCKEVLDRHGLFIPAHVDCPNTGAFKPAGSSAIEPVLKLEGVVAMEVTGSACTFPNSYREKKLQWTSVLGSDAHHPSAPVGATEGKRYAYPGSHWTWIKMGTNAMGAPTLASLKLALIDGPSVSVRRSDEPGLPADMNVEPEEALESIEIANAQVMGKYKPETLAFSPWLNSLVGGRGSGKSTVIHFLRLALRREGELERVGQNSEILKSFDRFRRKGAGGVVTDQTNVQVIYRHQGVRYRLQWPTVAGSADVQEWDSSMNPPAWKTAASQEILSRFPVRIFSQGQIAALAGERSGPLIEIVDQAVGHREWKARWDEEERTLFKLRTHVRELRAKLQNRDRTIAALEDVRRKLTRFEAAEHAKILKEFQLRGRQAREVERQFKEARALSTRIAEFTEDILPTDVGAGIFDPADQVGKEALDRINAVQEAIRKAADALRANAETLEKSVGVEEQSLGSTGWQVEVAATKTAYDKLVTELQAQGVQDPSEYGRLVQDRQRLELEVKALDSLKDTLDAASGQVNAQLQKLGELRDEISQKRSAFLAQTVTNDPYVKIELEAYGREPETLAESLRNVLGLGEEPHLFVDDIYLRKDEATEAVGLVASLLTSLPADKIGAQKALKQRIASMKEGLIKACVGEPYPAIGQRLLNRIKRSAENRPEFIDRILTWFPEDTLAVSYSPKGNGRDFVPILQGSAGQKAAAMLAFFLKYGTEPIILDQPEDDLDNHLIYKLVVSQIRQMKVRRQIITVTHNPNIVVNGDAEMVYALDFRSNQCRVVVKGGLQEESVRDEVCKVMEGGREAFEKRYQRIGNGGQNV